MREGTGPRAAAGRRSIGKRRKTARHQRKANFRFRSGKPSGDNLARDADGPTFPGVSRAGTGGTRHRFWTLRRFRLGVAMTIAIACCLAAGPTAADEEGHPARLTVNPDKVDFGREVVGRPTNPVTIKIQNFGTSTVTFDHLSIDVVRGEAGTFTELNVLKAVQCDGDASTLLPQHACLLFLQFTPPSAGQKRADLGVSFTTPNGGDQGDQGGNHGDDQGDHGEDQGDHGNGQGNHDHGRATVELEVNLQGDGVPSP